MTPDLLQLLLQLEQNRDVGTLYLGKGTALQRLFFSDDEVHLLDPGLEYRFLPSPMIVDREGFTRSSVDSVLAQSHKGQQGVATIFAERGLLPQEQVRAYQELETLERSLLSLDRHGSHFFFEAGSVPEELLMPTDDSRVGVPLAVFLRGVKERHALLKEFHTLFPSLEEVPVLSEAGIRAQTEKSNWVFGQVAELVDGFRSVHALLNDCIVFPHHTAIALTQAMSAGLFKKTRFPELDEVTPEAIAPREAGQWVDTFERAIPMAADDLPLRQRTAALCLRAGDADRAVFHYNVIGDILEHAGDFSRALQNYREALRWDSGSLILQEKCVRVFLRFAEEAFRNDQPEEGRRYLEEALAYNSTDLELYLRIVESYGDAEQAVQHALPRLLKLMLRAGHDELAISLFEELVRRAPHIDTLRKRFINYLLDHGETSRAVQELEQLAGSLLDRGARAEAHQIYEKIERLAPGTVAPEAARKTKQARPQKTRSGPRVSFVGVLALMTLGIFGAYQGYSLFALQELNKQVDALVAVELPTPGEQRHQEYMQSTDALLSDFRSYRRLHFASFWSPFAADLEQVLADRSQHLSQQLNRLLNGLMEQGERAEFRGRLAEAELLYRRVETTGEGTFWVARARQQLQELQQYRDEAANVAARMPVAEAAGDYAEAFRLAQELLYNYPRSQEAKDVKLPITIESLPIGAEVKTGRGTLGKTPLILRMTPFKAVTLQLELPGYEPDVIIIDNPKQQVHRVTLSPE
ncbi:MAG: hypothetical protein AAF581_15360 [Planctomycetota bacterium]